MQDARAGQVAGPEDLIDVARLVTAYYALHPDPAEPGQRVAFGTSGHRGSSLATAFNEDHIAATSQAICEYRAAQGTDGPLFLGADTHALSEPAWVTALEVFAANEVDRPHRPRRRLHAHPGRLPRHPRPQPRPRPSAVSPTASWSPPPTTRPPTAASSTTRRTAARPAPTSPPGSRTAPTRSSPSGLKDVRPRSRTPARSPRPAPAATTSSARTSPTCRASSTWTRSVRPECGSAPTRWAGRPSPTGARIAEQHRLDLTVVNPLVDPTWRFMTLDWDGKIRMDCSSPYAMASLIAQQRPVRHRHRQRRRRRPARHRHPGRGPDEPQPLPGRRDRLPLRPPRAAGPPTPASARRWCPPSMIDRVAADLGRRLVEVPVGFKWFVDGLVDGSLGFGGEESAGASFLRRDGSVWTTDKDGIILDLLACRDHARSPGKTPSQHYARAHRPVRRARLRPRSTPRRPASRRRLLAKLSPAQVTADTLAGEPVTARPHRGARQRRGHRRHQGRRPPTPGSRPGRRAPRTSTRSTPSPSAARTTSARCRRRPRPWSGRRWAADPEALVRAAVGMNGVAGGVGPTREP